MSIAEFLLARIAEVEADIPPLGDDPFLPYGQHWSEVPFLNASASFVVADLASKRALVKQVSDIGWGGYAVRDTVLGYLALPYADHPDYRPEWAL